MSLTDAYLSLREAILTSSTPPPCSADPEPWFSARPSERAQAAARCQPCPVRSECGRYANAARERWGVWGGEDHTKSGAAAEAA